MKTVFYACPGCRYVVSSIVIRTARFDYDCPRCGKHTLSEFVTWNESIWNRTNGTFQKEIEMDNSTVDLSNLFVDKVIRNLEGQPISEILDLLVQCVGRKAILEYLAVQPKPKKDQKLRKISLTLGYFDHEMKDDVIFLNKFNVVVITGMDIYSVIDNIRSMVVDLIHNIWYPVDSVDDLYYYVESFYGYGAEETRIVTYSENSPEAYLRLMAASHREIDIWVHDLSKGVTKWLDERLMM